MADKSIQINVNEVLELEYLVEETSGNTIDVGTNESNAEINYLSKEYGVFNPNSTGTNVLTINNQTIEIKVVDIPDSEANQKLVHRWVLNDVDTGTVVDSVGSADGTVTGTTSVNGSWAGGYAGNFDGNDYISTTTLGSYGSILNTNIAMAASVQVASGESGKIFGVRNDGDYPQHFRFYIDGNGYPYLDMRDAGGASGDNADYLRLRADTTVDDGNKHRVVCCKTGDTSGDFYIDQTKVGTVVDNASGHDQAENLDYPLVLGGENNQGSTTANFNGVLDDICLYNDSLTSTEATSYNNPWS